MKKKTSVAYLVAPSPHYVSTSLQPLNSYYALQELNESLDLVFLLDNDQVAH